MASSEPQQPNSVADVDRSRGGACGRRAVTELAVAVLSPTLEEHVGREVRAHVW